MTHKIKLFCFLTICCLWSCEKDILFDTVDPPEPTVKDSNWSANGMGFAEGGRVMRLPNPLDENNPYREIEFQTTINSNDSRKVDSIHIDLQFIPSIPSNAALGWIPYTGFRIPSGEQSSTYDFKYTLNLDEWSDVATVGFCGAGGCQPKWIGTGSLPQFGLTVNREDNVMRLNVFFDDGSWVRLAQVQFSYALNEDGEE